MYKVSEIADIISESRTDLKVSYIKTKISQIKNGFHISTKGKKYWRDPILEPDKDYLRVRGRDVFTKPGKEKIIDYFKNRE